MDGSVVNGLLFVALTALCAVVGFGLKALLTGQKEMSDKLSSITTNQALSRQAFEAHLKEDERRIGFLEKLVIKFAADKIDTLPDAE